MGFLKRLKLAVGFASVLTVAWVWCFGPGPWRFDTDMLHRGQDAATVTDRWLAQAVGGAVGPIDAPDLTTRAAAQDSNALVRMAAPTAGAADSAALPAVTVAAPVEALGPSPVPALAGRGSTTVPLSTSVAAIPATDIASATAGAELPTPTDAPARPAPEGVATLAPTVVPPGPDGSYTVQTGDTLALIAARYGTTSAAILASSGLTRDQFVYLGQTLTIPGDWSGVGDTPMPEATPPSAGGATVTSSLTASGLTPGVTTFPTTGVVGGLTSTTLAAALANRNAPITYTVQSGDYLVAIARKYGTSVEAIAASNQITDPARIRAGMTLTIPVAGATLTPETGR
jgi:LysM repeat protein